MNRKLTIYIVFIVLVLALIIAIDAAKPKPINWRESYSIKDKIPFGLYIFDKEAPILFNNKEIKKFSVTPYEFYEPLYDYDSSRYTVKGNFICIDNINRMDHESAKELVYFAEHGNTVFLSMKDFPTLILDTLKVEIDQNYVYKDSMAFSIENMKGHKRYFSEGASPFYFSSIDTLTTTVLGYQEFGKEKLTNLIRIPFGNGSFILHTQPAVFSNFHLLKGNHYEYTEKLLSYLPEGDVFWYTKNYSGQNISDSSLRYILSQPGLRWAYYMSLISLLLFIIFNARRKQRIVPEIEPVRNTTVDFTKTIGNLYYQEGNHHTIIEKKIVFFLEHIRNTYLLDTFSLDDVFIDKLHQKTGKPLEDIQKTVSLINKHRHHFDSTEADVIEINKAIENLRL